MKSALTEKAIRTFDTVFGGFPDFLSRAPGRVNLIGEHTDYNDGLVLPAAIERGVVIAGRPMRTGMIRFHAAAFGETAEIPADRPMDAVVPRWARYPQGVAVELARRFRLLGLEGVIAADLPIGSGLSSSAALEVAASIALEHAAGQAVATRQRALLCHKAEVDFVGVPCGIMDQFASVLSRRGHALFIDCRSHDAYHIPLPADLVIAVCDTGVRRTVSDSSYAARRQECVDAVRLLGERRPSIQSLRDVPIDDLALIEELPDSLCRRARHVITETQRVVHTAQALESGEIASLRDLFLASHRSLRDDYEVSSVELDAMVDSAVAAPGCVAARMTGAGFGGAAVALVRRKSQDAFLESVAVGYATRMSREGSFFVSEAAEGAHLIELA